MRRSTDRLIALQFLAVAVPIAFVLLAQMVGHFYAAKEREQFGRPKKKV